MKRCVHSHPRTATLILGLALAATAACRSEYKKHCDLGKQLRNEERYEEAIKEYELAAKVAPKEARPYESIAKIYKHQIKYDVAAKYYQKALEVDPTYIDAYAQWVKMLRLAGQLDQASQIAADALAKNEIKRDMKATREIQEQVAEIEKTRNATAAPPPSPPPVATPRASATLTTAPIVAIPPPPAKP